MGGEGVASGMIAGFGVLGCIVDSKFKEDDRKGDWIVSIDA